nr:tyrosine-type recombinase/integrase [uncultured Agathobaculum sp.]
MQQQVTRPLIDVFTKKLQAAERSAGTIEKYRRDVQSFITWLGARDVSHEAAAEWKQHLQVQGYSPATINSMLVAVNRFFDCMGWQDCRVKTLKIQRRLFRQENRNLSKEEYIRLINTACQRGMERLALLMETICATGIRVSEVQYITVEAARQGRTEISLKGKIRTILLPGKLCRKLLKYARKQKTVSGEIFLTRNGTGLSRKQIWAEMKALCRFAGVEASKVFPHNLRHLFAQTFYRVTHDVAKLADLLGHSSIETTRIYLIATGAEHEGLINKLKLII